MTSGDSAGPESAAPDSRGPLARIGALYGSYWKLAADLSYAVTLPGAGRVAAITGGTAAY